MGTKYGDPMSIAVSKCPSRSCSGSPQQLNLHSNYFIAIGIDAPWIADAMQCSGCGSVYSIGADGQQIERGRFDVDEADERLRWKPARSRSD